MYEQFYIQITLSVKCELKWSLKWQISQSQEPNGGNTSSTLCQIHIKAAQINCTSGHDQERMSRQSKQTPTSTFLSCNRRGSNISKCLVLLYSLKIHNIYQSQLRPCVSLFQATRVEFAVTDGGFVWLGSWRVTPHEAPVQEWTCCSLCYAFWGVWHEPHCHVPSSHYPLTPALRHT